jgi:hypothetical protein
MDAVTFARTRLNRLGFFSVLELSLGGAQHVPLPLRL